MASPIDALSLPAFIIYTLVIGFLGALLGAAGKHAGIDLYSMIKEILSKPEGSSWTNSKLQKQMKILSRDIKLFSENNHFSTITSAPDDLTIGEIYDANDKWLDELSPRLQKVHNELHARGEVNPQLPSWDSIIRTDLNYFLRRAEEAQENDVGLADVISSSPYQPINEWEEWKSSSESFHSHLDELYDYIVTIKNGFIEEYSLDVKLDE